MTDREKNMQFLEEALSNERLSHSYIFSGIEDVGYAVTIAQKILCRREHTGCGSCSSCLKVLSNNHPDLMIIEPDGASIKNEQVEAFQNFMVIKPFESVQKIAIFNGVHVMTTRAQNRLLKILEEPPAYALMILMSTQAEMLLDTITSRCQTLSFHEDTAVENEVLEHAIDFVKSLEFNDINHIFGFSVYAKEDKVRFMAFLRKVNEILRDIMIFKETQNIQLISRENFTILDNRSQLSQLSGQFSHRRLMTLIFAIEEVEAKLKSNMNFDLTIDQLLFKCLSTLN
jgi:DNA polymerase-3 subunit delta'